MPVSGIKYHPAKWWTPEGDKKVKCELCPRNCIIKKGQHGFCFIRQNIDGKLYSAGYGYPTGFGVDPIEKKPLNHFYPGTEILSFGTLGCNLGCKFCQNWNISKSTKQSRDEDYISAEDIVLFTKKRNIPAIAFTYNDPDIFGEFVIDVSRLAKKENIKTVMVSAGYINPEPRKEVYKYIDAANIDLKAFSAEFYKKFCSVEIDKILDTILWIKQETNVWMELTTLLIPDLNDSEKELNEMCSWIVENLGPDVPIHFTAFHPDFKLKDKPRTSVSTLITARNIALKNGMNYVYTGNVHSEETQTTFCPKCSQKLIKRDWHSVAFNLVENGECFNCKTKISGRF